MQNGRQAYILLPPDYQPKVGDHLEIRDVATADGPAEPTWTLTACHSKEPSRSPEAAAELRMGQIAHEIRNTIMILDYELRNFSQCLPPGEQARTERAIRRLEDLRRLCEEITRPSSDNPHFRWVPQSVDLRRELAPFFKSFEERAHHTHLHFEVGYFTGVPERIRIDMTQLRLILTNLIENALRHTHQGCIKVHFSGYDRHLRILVSDTGEGIPASFQNELFKPFRSSQKSEKGCIPRGLGLTTARQLARCLGGDVTLVRTSPGWGSIFEVQVEFEPA